MTTNEVESNREEGDENAPMTAGQRLAAQKAAKAARKAAKRGREGEVRETEAIKRASVATDWIRSNRSMVTGAVIAVLAIAILGAGLVFYQGNRASASAGLLGEAARTATAEVIPEGESDEGIAESYGSTEARAEAALERYRKVVAEGSGDAVAWGRLGEGAALLQLGKPADARRAYEAARAEGDEVFLTAKALEGIGFSHEAEKAWDKALATYGELAKLDGGAYKELAQLHQARVELAQGDEAKGKATLTALRTRLREENAPKLPYVKRQADAMLRQLDATLAADEAGETQFSQEQLEELLRRLQAQGVDPTGGAGE